MQGHTGQGWQGVSPEDLAPPLTWAELAQPLTSSPGSPPCNQYLLTSWLLRSLSPFQAVPPCHCQPLESDSLLATVGYISLLSQKGLLSAIALESKICPSTNRQMLIGHQLRARCWGYTVNTIQILSPVKDDIYLSVSQVKLTVLTFIQIQFPLPPPCGSTWPRSLWEAHGSKVFVFYFYCQLHSV